MLPAAGAALLGRAVSRASINPQARNKRDDRLREAKPAELGGLGAA
jgi:hypothetical protein